MTAEKKKPGPWVPTELPPPMPEAKWNAMVDDPEESARVSLYDLETTFEAMEVTELAQMLDFVGHADLAARLVTAVNELAAAIKAAGDALGESPYV